MLIILLIVLIVLMVGGLPPVGIHPYGWGPSGVVGVLLVVVVILLLLRLV